VRNRESSWLRTARVIAYVEAAQVLNLVSAGNFVVAQTQHIELIQSVQPRNMCDGIVEKGQVSELRQSVKPFDDLNVVEGQIWCRSR